MPFLAAGRRFGSHDDDLAGVGDLLDLLDQRPAWHRRAACRTAGDREDFFSATVAGIERGRAACSACPVLGACRSWALAQGPELYGTWGGLTRADRQAINGPRRAGRRSAAWRTRTTKGTHQ